MDYAVLFLLTLAVFHTEARVFTKCELVRELRRHGFPESQLRDWVCLVQHESEYNTKAIGRMNKDGSTDYGLFQINDNYWCSSGSSPGKGCHIRCKDLLLDDIKIAAQCAKHIFGVHGFKAWEAWKTHCQGRPLPDISSC